MEPSDLAVSHFIAPIVIVLAALAGLLVLTLVRSAHRRTARRRQMLLELGFAPIDIPDPALIEVFQALFRRHSEQKITVKILAHRPVRQGDLYLFEMMDHSSSESHPAQEVLGMVSPDLDLPYLVLLPYPAEAAGQQGFLGQAAQSLFDWAFGQAGLDRVHFADYPDFERAYIVVGEDETQIRRYLNEDRIDRLSSVRLAYHFTGRGHVLALQTDAPTHKPAGPGTLQDRMEAIQGATEILAGSPTAQNDW